MQPWKSILVEPCTASTQNSPRLCDVALLLHLVVLLLGGLDLLGHDPRVLLLVIPEIKVENTHNGPVDLYLL